MLSVNSARDKFILFSFFMQILTIFYDYCINATKNVNEYSFPFKVLYIKKKGNIVM